jgi:hypothetical protein
MEILFWRSFKKEKDQRLYTPRTDVKRATDYTISMWNLQKDAYSADSEH